MLFEGGAVSKRTVVDCHNIRHISGHVLSAVTCLHDIIDAGLLKYVYFSHPSLQGNVLKKIARFKSFISCGDR